jgi:hypothetical protein
MAAGSTYTPIATTTLASAAASYTFSSISGSYTDLVLVIQGGLSAASQDMYVQFNSDTGSNYSITVLKGNGTAASSARLATQTYAILDYQGEDTTNYGDIHLVNIMNYSNTTTYKTFLNRHSRPSGWVEAVVGLWRSTSAISTILVGGTSSNLVAGTTLTLYGIAAA